MITRKQLETAFGDDRDSYTVKDIDYDVTIITLLRERIPYEVSSNILVAAEHDILYLCDVEKALPYLTEKDLEVLADCNVIIDNDCLALYV